MLVDTSKLESVGIDRVVLNNFKVLNFDELEKKEIIKSQEIIERLEIKDEMYTMTCSRNSNATGEAYTFSTLEFNPNRLEDGHNLYNSNLLELYTNLQKILKSLKARGINVDITDAKIKEIEINTTLIVSFEILQEVILLIGRANYQKALGIYSFNHEDIPHLIRKERSLYLNAKMTDFKKGNTGKVIKLYDKTFEMFLNHNIVIDKELTRIEVLFGQDYFRNVMERLGLDNTLKTFLSNDVLEDIFFRSLKTELINKPNKYLEKIKKNLIFEFNNFKRNEKVKRQYREQLKALGKDIPDAYREERGVFEYLKKESWIFDFSFLLEITKEYISPKHRSIYEKQILKKYIKTTNLSLYEFLLKKIFGDNFFTNYTKIAGRDEEP